MSEVLIKSIAVCGLGRIGWHHAECCEESESFHLVAACDENSQILSDAGAKWDIQTYSDWRAMLGKTKADTVAICTPSHLHFEMVMEALQHGFHVIVEKPVASSAAEVREMISAANAADRLLTVCQTLRYQPDSVVIKKYIESQYVGGLDHISLRRNTGMKERKDWQIWRKFNGGLLSNMGVHLIDSILHVCPEERPRMVFANLRKMLNQGDAEDVLNVAIEFESGLFSEIEIYRSFFHKPMWELAGDRGTVVIDGSLPKAELRAMQEGQREPLTQMIDFAEGPTNLLSFYRDLECQLHAGGDAPITMESVLRLMIVIDAIRESSQQKTAVRVPTENEVVFA